MHPKNSAYAIIDDYDYYWRLSLKNTKKRSVHDTLMADESNSSDDRAEAKESKDDDVSAQLDMQSRMLLLFKEGIVSMIYLNIKVSNVYINVPTFLSIFRF
jgi:hypothetical protein